jgi:hypothetical protein
MAIKNAVIEAMIEKWNLEARNPECEDGSESAKLGNAKNHGRREAIAKCADQLQVLLNLLATDDRKDELTDKRA